MELEEFIEKVKEMRAVQRAYFAHRKQSDLIESIRLERIIDEALRDGIIIPILDTKPDKSEPGEQAGLFD